MHQIVCRLGLHPRLHWGSLQRSPRPHSWLKGSWGKGRREGGEKEGFRDHMRGGYQ